MILLTILLISLSATPCVLADSVTDNGKIIKIQQLSKEADLSTLKKDYSVSTSDTRATKSDLVTVQERDSLFKKAHLLDSLKKYDQLDRDIIFHTIKKRGVDACLKKYPELESMRPQLTTLYNLLKK